MHNLYDVNSNLTIMVSWEAIRIKGADREIYDEDHRPQGSTSVSLTAGKYQATRRL